MGVSDPLTCPCGGFSSLHPHPQKGVRRVNANLFILAPVPPADETRSDLETGVADENGLRAIGM